MIVLKLRLTKTIWREWLLFMCQGVQTNKVHATLWLWFRGTQTLFNHNLKGSIVLWVTFTQDARCSYTPSKNKCIFLSLTIDLNSNAKNIITPPLKKIQPKTMTLLCIPNKFRCNITRFCNTVTRFRESKLFSLYFCMGWQTFITSVL